MADYDMSIHTNPSAEAWVKFFRECNPDCNVPDDLMQTWFANSMMAMHDYLTGQQVTVLDDGSAFFVATVPGAPDIALLDDTIDRAPIATPGNTTP